MQISDEHIKEIKRRINTISHDEQPVTSELVASVAANFDLDAATTEEAKNFKAQLWDKKSPINGVPAQDVLAARQDIPEDGEVYLVIDKRNDNVLFFQPHAPGVEGFTKIKKSNWEEISGKQISELARERAMGRFETEISNKMKDKGE